MPNLASLQPRGGTRDQADNHLRCHHRRRSPNRSKTQTEKSKAMLKDITQSLPQVVADHVAAHNNHDPDALMATLAPDAMLNDAQREFVGHEAIRAWADKEIFGDNVTLATEVAYEQHGDIIARFRVDGDFDKSK